MEGSDPIFIDNHSKIGVLLLHGFTSTPRQFREMSEYLSKRGFNVYAPLIAGHGTTPEDLNKTRIEDWKKSASDAYAKLKNCSDKIFLVGNSFGSNLALWLAKEHDKEIIGVATLGAPIFLKYHLFILFRYYTYGFMKKYYKKPKRVYSADYTDLEDELTYPVIPIKSLMNFLKFIKKETIPNLSYIHSPIFIGHSDTDPVVHPKSAEYIYRHIGSKEKKIHWFSGRFHTLSLGARRHEVFQKISTFLNRTLNE